MHVKTRKVKPFVTHAGYHIPAFLPLLVLAIAINIPRESVLSEHEKHVPLVEGMGSSGGWIDESNVCSVG